MNQRQTLAQAATDFLASLEPNERQDHRQELNKFVRWCGTERPLQEISAQDVSKYAESLDSSSPNAARNASSIKAFLSYAKKNGLIMSNLSVHLRVKKSSTKQPTIAKEKRQTIAMTTEGYRELEAELTELKKERPRIAEQLRLAAADKDLRENAPLETAKEHQGQIEARIREIEATLNASTIVKKKPKGTKTVGVGCTVSLRDLGSGEQLRYILVSPSEANPTKGKLSIASPTGKALLDNEIGAVIEVIAPVGTLRYQIDEIKG